MAGYSNNMTKLVDKIEKRLGLNNIPMPEEYRKDKWATQIIISDTLTTFSRFYQRKIKYHVDDTIPRKNGWCFLDEDKLGGNDVEVLGILDIDFMSLRNQIHTQGYGNADMFSSENIYDPGMFAMAQMGADYSSLFDSGIYLEQEEPNKFRLVSTINQDLSVSLMREYDLYILIKHSSSLTTISPTMMETFENLAIADISTYLYNCLKYYDGLETLYVTLDMKLDDLKTKADTRDNIIELLDEYHTSSSNQNQPMIITV